MDRLKRIAQLAHDWQHSKNAAARETARQFFISLDDMAYFEPLQSALNNWTDEEHRRVAYWMLESLVRFTQNRDVAEYLMKQVDVETKKAVKVDLLQRLCFAVRTVRIRDASPAIACLSEKMRNLRSEAYRSLGATSDPRAEPALIDFVQSQLPRPSENGWFLYHAMQALSQIATARSVPILKRLLGAIRELQVDTRKEDIEAMAVKALARSGSTAGQLAAMLGDADRSTRARWQAMLALKTLASAKQVPQIRTRIMAILASK